MRDPCVMVQIECLSWHIKCRTFHQENSPGWQTLTGQAGEFFTLKIEPSCLPVGVGTIQMRKKQSPPWRHLPRFECISFSSMPWGDGERRSGYLPSSRVLMVNCSDFGHPASLPVCRVTILVMRQVLATLRMRRAHVQSQLQRIESALSA